MADPGSVSSTHTGWRRLIDNTGSNLASFSQGQPRMQVGSATLAAVGANTAALLHGMGTSGTPVGTTSGSVNFMGYWMTTSATSGDVRGFYSRLFFTGAGGTGRNRRNTIVFPIFSFSQMYSTECLVTCSYL